MSEDGLYVHHSILDTDLYKFTMQQAIRHHFPDTRAVYKFIHRDPDVLFPRACVDLFHKSIQRFRDLRLTADERDWLARTCPFLGPDFLDYLFGFRFNPAQLSVAFVPVSDDGEHGRVKIELDGPWKEAVLWEIPVMSCLSELYFRVGVTDWGYEGQKENAAAKARTLIREGCTFIEFGTRRRRSFQAQDIVIATIKEEAERTPGPGVFVGTSNAYFAKKYNLHLVGTVAHEWFMGVAALRGYEGANATALGLWEKVYPNNLFAALTDTFTTKVFFQDFARDQTRPAKWNGLRQDSGDPFAFAPAAKVMYDSVGVDARSKNIVFSDSLNVDKAVRLKKQCDEIGIKCSFGIGTFLTNDFKTKSSGYAEKSRALNIVVKLAKVDDRHCVKISDDLTKNTGDKASVEYVKKFYGLVN